MTLDDLDWERGEILVRGKGQRLERLPLPKDVGTALVQYLRQVRPTWGELSMEDRNIKKLAYVLAAVATVAVGAPTIASAAEFGFSVGGDHDYYRDRDYRGPRAEINRHDRGLHRGWYHHDRDYYGDRGVVIRRGYGDDY